MSGVRGIGPGIRGQGWYVKWAPNWGAALPWFGKRLRWGPHHGLQLVEWRRGRGWAVTKQLLGRSKVKGERFDATVR